MALETGTYINDLVTTNPVGASDPVSDGDGHFRLVKSVLKTTLPNADKAFDLAGLSTFASITGNVTLVAGDFYYLEPVSRITAAAVVTLPALSGVVVGKRRAFLVATTGAVSFARAGTDTIEGATSLTAQNGDRLALYSDGTTDWKVRHRGRQGFVAARDYVGDWTQQQYFATATLTDAANISWNLDSQQVATVTLGGNRTLDNPTNLKNGAAYRLTIKQDATGGRTLAFGTAYKFAGGIDPAVTSAASALDMLSCVSDGTSMFCTIVQDVK